jgi:peroxiredoxin
MQSDFATKGLVVAGVTSAPTFEAEQFQVEFGLNYPVLADAESVFEGWGVKRIWGSVVYLVDRDGKIVARGIDATRAELEKRTS